MHDKFRGMVGVTGIIGSTGNLDWYTGGDITQGSSPRGARPIIKQSIPQPVRLQPLYDEQTVDANTKELEFFQRPVIPERKEIVQWRESNGRFAPKKTIKHPQQRSYSETNMDTPGYLMRDYEITGIGIVPSLFAKKGVEYFAENTYLTLEINGITVFKMATPMLLCKRMPEDYFAKAANYSFGDTLKLKKQTAFKVTIASAKELGATLTSPFKIRCIIRGFYN